MSIFQFNDYKAFVKFWMQAQPKKGRGLYLEWSKQLRVSSTLMSQIFSGSKEMSLELANDFCELMGFSHAEADYFLLLVEHARAGTTALRKRYKRKIDEEQTRAQNLSTRLKVDRELPDQEKAIFYSSWLYAAIRNLSALKEFQNVDSISAHLNLPRQNVQKMIEFLLENGLCIVEKGRLNPGPKRTHVGATSPFVIKHHQNWRLQSLNRMPILDENELFFTFPMSLSEEDAKKIRQAIPTFIEEIHKIVGPSPSETVRCLNIDFFKY